MARTHDALIADTSLYLAQALLDKNDELRAELRDVCVQYRDAMEDCAAQIAALTAELLLAREQFDEMQQLAEAVVTSPLWTTGLAGQMQEHPLVAGDTPSSGGTEAQRGDLTECTDSAVELCRELEACLHLLNDEAEEETTVVQSGQQ